MYIMDLPEAQFPPPPGAQDAGGIRLLPGRDPRFNDADLFNFSGILKAQICPAEIQNLSTN